MGLKERNTYRINKVAGTWDLLDGRTCELGCPVCFGTDTGGNCTACKCVPCMAHITVGNMCAHCLEEVHAGP